MDSSGFSIRACYPTATVVIHRDEDAANVLGAAFLSQTSVWWRDESAEEKMRLMDVWRVDDDGFGMVKFELEGGFD